MKLTWGHGGSIFVVDKQCLAHGRADVLGFRAHVRLDPAENVRPEVAPVKLAWTLGQTSDLDRMKT
jgi:L-asparaginase/Glu-tRNA(Gln) amidotransferase subunit D